MSRIGEVRKDPGDGEFVWVEDASHEDGEVVLDVRSSSTPKELASFGEEEFDNIWTEHVLGRKEVWRIYKEASPYFIGTDVEIINTTLDTVHWRVARRGPLMHKDVPEGYNEVEKLSRFLDRCRFLSWTKDDLPVAYVTTDADKKAVTDEESTRTGLEELLKIAGAAEPKRVTKAEMLKGLGISIRIDNEADDDIRSVLEAIGVDVPDKGEPNLKEVSKEDRELAIGAVSQFMKIVKALSKKHGSDMSDEDKIKYTIEAVNSMDDTLAKPSPMPWSRGQVRRGDLLNIATNYSAEDTSVMPDLTFRVLTRLANNPERAPLWSIEVTE